MEAMTSEQELKTLLDEGKITQEEYDELLAAMKDKPRQDTFNGGSKPRKFRISHVILIIVLLLGPIILYDLWLGFRRHLNQSRPMSMYKEYPCDTLDSLIVGQTGAPVEKGIFSEDQGAIRIQVLQADTFHLYETGPLGNASNTMLFYRAKIKTESLNGRAYLELWCSIPGRGEFFSRGLDQTISGTNNWTTMQIPFRNDSGINPDNIKLNLVVEGSGTIWIDDIQVSGQGL